MKLTHPIRVSEIARLLDTSFAGDGDIFISGINEVNRVEFGDLAFVDHPKYYSKTLSSAASAILINEQVPCPDNKCLIFTADPFRDFNRVVAQYYQFKAAHQSISSSAIIGEGTQIQPNVFIGHEVVIGKNCVLHPGVVIYDRCILGDNVIVHANSTIGADAFYYKKRPTGHDKLLSCGRVIIEDEVEIGANTTIDRGVSHDTRIGRGTKLDNHVHIGHDTRVGQHCLFAAHVGVAGATVIEDHVTLWGQVGVNSKITIGEGAVLLAQSAVANSLKGHTTYLGTPAINAKQETRQIMALRQVPELLKKVRKLSVMAD